MSDNDNLTYGVVETMGDDVFIIFCRSPLNKSKQNDIANLRFFFKQFQTVASILLVYQVYNHFNHNILFFGAALGYHKRKGGKCVVGNALAAICGVEDAVAVHEPNEKRSGNTFVAVGERVVFHH